MKSKTHIHLVTVAFLSLSPALVKAENVETKNSSNTERGYAYTFEDDPLGASPIGDRGARLTVRPIGKRTLLIRPRTHFIDELFESAVKF